MREHEQSFNTVVAEPTRGGCESSAADGKAPESAAAATNPVADLPPIRVALTYRVLQHWRVPVFRRLAKLLQGNFRAFHGPDFPGTKTVNAKNLSGFEHRQLWAVRFHLRRGRDHVGLPFCPTLLYHLFRYRPDVLLCEGGSNLLNNWLVWLYSVLTGTPYVWWTLGELRPLRRVPLPLRIWRSAHWFLESRAAVFLGYSSLAQKYFDSQGYPAQRQFRAVNCVDTDAVFARIPQYEELSRRLRRELGLEGKQVLLFVGAIYPTKRLEDLIDAYCTLRARHPGARLVIVGDGPHRQAIEEYARAKSADAIFVGEVIEQVSAYFLLADIFVLPGLGGLSISEAMAHGLPVIATEADGCEVDLIEDGRNGYLIGTGDVGRLTDRLDQMLSDPQRTRQMGAHSKWIIENRYNIHTYMANVTAALRCAYECSPKRRRRLSQSNKRPACAAH
jgi:glycosyltransferase involved in cell wall biosynthesis